MKEKLIFFIICYNTAVRIVPLNKSKDISHIFMLYSTVESLSSDLRRLNCASLKAIPDNSLSGTFPWLLRSCSWLLASCFFYFPQIQIVGIGKPQTGQFCLYSLLQLFLLQTGVFYIQPCVGLLSLSVSPIVQ